MFQLIRKLLSFFDRYALKICVSFLIFFIAIYPKLPSIHINHTWVYIRLEDFAIAFTVVIWLLTIIRRKARFSIWLGVPFFAYWIFGLISLVYSIIYISPLLLNYFPSIAALSYLRRIEYMILFFVAFSSVKNVDDLKDYLKILIFTTLVFTIYGFGQKFYIYFWNAFPDFFTKHPFCFPSFQTGNEEFAKGIPLCLPFDGRITSTFAGHYDLSAYLVLVIPIFIALIFTIKKKLYKVLFSIFTLLTIIMLILTSSRISFPSYLIGSAISLILVKKKKFIIPLIIISIVLLPLFSSSMAKRFLQTFRITNIVVDSQGHIVGEELSPELQKQLNNKYLGNKPTQDLPAGTGFIGLPQDVREKTNTAVVRSTLTPEEARRLKLENGGVELSAVKGNFTLKRALVYDISLTTRLQAEWPNAIRAFSRNFLIGSGFSTITLATDNDFLRFLGETGILGLFSFLSIFVMLFITFRRLFASIKDPVIKAFGAGLAGGIVGIFLNATLFDIFEASKVAETMWILLGIGFSVLLLTAKSKIDYIKELRAVFTSNLFLMLYLIIIVFVFFGASINNFFVADDFTWLKWAANTTPDDIFGSFINASGFFYRPFDKLIMFVLYAFFAFKPQGYHVFMLMLHALTGIGIYLLSLKIFKNKALSFISSFIFLFLPIHAENLYWISTISNNLSTLFIVFGLLSFYRFRNKGSIISYILSLILFSLALFSYEASIVFILLVVLFDMFLLKVKINIKALVAYAPYVLVILGYLLLRGSSGALGPNGDYSYNFLHLIPNVIGNFFGYLFGSIFGESVFPYYLLSRAFFAENIFMFVVVIILLFVILAWLILKQKSKLFNLIKSNEIRIFIFGLLFFFVSNITFLGLGNISERYVYLPSIGFIISFILVIKYFVNKIGNYLNIDKNKLMMGVLLLLSVFYYKELMHSNNEWQNAGKITNRTLSYLKIYHEKVSSNSNLLFVNTPIRFEDAWVFPVGLPDGIWFIYNDDTLNIKNVNNLIEAKAIKSTNENKTYIFEFKNYVMEEVKK